MTSVPSVRTKRGGSVDVSTNEDYVRLEEPVITDMKGTTMSPEKVKAGIQKEMESMDYFDVYEEVPAEAVDEETRRTAIGTRFHLRDKGDECRARLVVQDYWRTV